MVVEVEVEVEVVVVVPVPQIPGHPPNSILDGLDR